MALEIDKELGFRPDSDVMWVIKKFHIKRDHSNDESPAESHQSHLQCWSLSITPNQTKYFVISHLNLAQHAFLLAVHLRLHCALRCLCTPSDETQVCNTLLTLSHR